MSSQSNSFNKGAIDNEKHGEIFKDKFYNQRLDHIRETNTDIRHDIRSLQAEIRQFTSSLNDLRTEINRTISGLESTIGKIDTRLENVEKEKISRWDAALVSGTVFGGAIAVVTAISKVLKGP